MSMMFLWSVVDENRMYRNTIMRKVSAHRLLHEVSLELTWQCNLNCFYCVNDRENHGMALSLVQYRTLFEDLARMQTLFLMLTGGEPMLHPHFFEIGRMTREFGFVVRVRTNGHALFPRNVDRLQKEVDPYLVEVSLHGASAEVHDRQTRVPGSFDRLIRHLRHTQSAGLRCRTVATPTAWNQHQIEAMIALGDELGAPLRFQGPVGPRSNGDITPLSIQPSRETWDRIEALMAERNANKAADASKSNRSGKTGGLEDSLEPAISPHYVEEIPATCNVGRVGVDIDPFGNVLACMNLREIAGNLHEQSIEEIWNHSPLFARVHQRAVDAATDMGGKQPRQFGAPLFCLGVAENCARGEGADEYERRGRP